MRKLLPNQCRHHTTTLTNDITTLWWAITLQPSRCLVTIKLQSDLQLITTRLIILPPRKDYYPISSLKYGIVVSLLIRSTNSLLPNYYTTTTTILLPSYTVKEFNSYYHFLTLLQIKRHSPITHKLPLVHLLWRNDYHGMLSLSS